MPTRVTHALAVISCVLLTAGCGGSAGPEPDAEDAAADGTSTDAATVPETAPDDATTAVADCNGVETAVGEPPDRVVTLTGSVLEMIFWLGAEDRVIGAGTPPQPGTFPEQFDEAAQQVPKLSGEYEAGAFQPVPREVLLGNDPDFVVGGFSSNFEAEGAATQDDLAERDIGSYLALSTSCTGVLSGAQEDLELVYQDLSNLGAVLGAEDVAEGLIEEMQAQVDEVAERTEEGGGRPTVFAFEYDEGTDTPYATGNRQTINAVIELAGGRNAFADLDTDYERVGWEEVVERDPDVILVITYADPTEEENEASVEEAEEFLTGFPPLANLEAITERRFTHLLYEEGSVGGVRNADAVTQLAGALRSTR